MATDTYNWDPSSLEAISAGYNELYGQAMGEVDKYGKQQTLDRNAYWQAQQNAGLAAATNKGLGGTTVLSSLRMGYGRERGNDLSRLGESVAKLRLGYMTQLKQAQLNYQQWAQQLQMENMWKGKEYGLSEQQLGLQQQQITNSYALGQGQLGLGYAQLANSQQNYGNNNDAQIYANQVAANNAAFAQGGSWNPGSYVPSSYYA